MNFVFGKCSSEFKLKSKNILISAFACDPFFGSDEEVGWQWAKRLSKRGFDVTVITRTSHQKAISAHVESTKECANVRFIYVDLAGLHSVLRHINRRNHIYYYFWQWRAYTTAKKLHAENPFDLVHHVTWVSFRQPSFMGLLGVPMIFGPVAGGDEIPKGYASAFSTKQKLIEVVRGIANSIVRYDPFMRMTYRHASQVFFTSEGHLQRVPSFVKSKAAIELAIGSEPTTTENLPPSTFRRGNRLLFAGRCIGWKGMDIGLRVFAKIREVRPDVTLTIIGDGADRERWMLTAEALGISDSIEWLGWLPKAKVLELYKEFDILFYPSLRDSGGFVVLEALQNGMPVVCFRLGGPGVVVDDTCGAAVVATSSISETIDNYARLVLQTLHRSANDEFFSTACQARANKFTWDALIERIYSKNLG